jgi:hypothetical protein
VRPLAHLRGALLAAAAIAGLAAFFASATPAHGQSAIAPEARFAVGTPAMQAAQAIAVGHWGVDPCAGAVEIAWVPLDEHVNGISSWSVTRGAYEAPEDNRDCRIELNTEMAFDWPKFCTVLVHEYGHLAGHPHDEHPGHLMSAVYSRPLAECSPTGTRRATGSRRLATGSRGA